MKYIFQVNLDLGKPTQRNLDTILDKVNTLLLVNPPKATNLAELGSLGDMDNPASLRRYRRVILGALEYKGRLDF